MAKKKFDPAARDFGLSRTALEEHLACPRCFYQKRRLGFTFPSGPFSQLPNAVDALLKREFDAYRERQEPHPLMVPLTGDLVPFRHANMERWRQNFTGLQVHHEPSGLVFSGAVDDIWQSRETEELHIVDYKTSSVAGPITSIYDSYQRQVEMYQFMLRGEGFSVSDTAYFVFQQPIKDAPALDQALRFIPTVLAHVGNCDWVGDALLAARACLDAEEPPAAAEGCDLCSWVTNVTD